MVAESRIQSSKVVQIHDFFENPSTKSAVMVQVLIYFLIFLSVALVLSEFYFPIFFQQNLFFFEVLNYIILLVFTIEYALRVITAPKKLAYMVSPFNVIDFLAVFPNYIELIFHFFVPSTGLRAIRFIRLLRVGRLLRGFRLLKFCKSVTPVLFVLLFIKLAIWGLEEKDVWIPESNLSELFTIIGFALGVILSQKVSVSYKKFIQVEDASVRLYATLQSLSDILDTKIKGLGTSECRIWAKGFLEIFENPDADNYKVEEVNARLYSAISRVEKKPAQLAILYGGICRDAAFCIGKKVRFTPPEYDGLLHQSTILYLFLMAIFIPGLVGVISVSIATYVLYGLYILIKDFDSIIGGEYNLINIDISELRHMAKLSQKK